MYLASKRALDIAAAIVGLVLSSPILAAAALAIRRESPGPVVYRQQRVGLDGQRFEMFKLRTMIPDAEFVGAGMAVAQGDPRITRIGALLRRFSLDELPNLLNILRGEMSLVGPRPTIPAQVAQYTPREYGRLAVKPGLTGWAQVQGRASLPWSQRIELDLDYIAARSLALDLRIIMRTAALVLGGRGLYKGSTGGWDR